MARRFYTQDDLERVKHDFEALHSELIPARRPGSGDRRCYVCPACGHDGKVRIYKGHKDGAAVWSCVHCRRAGNVIDLYMLRDGLSRGEAATAVCDRWAGDAQEAHRGAPTTPRTISGEGVVDTTPSDDRRQEIRRYCLTAAARLWTPQGRRGRDYLHGRGLSDDTIRRFRVGYDGQCDAGGSLQYGRAAIILPYSPRADYFGARFLKPIDGSDGKPVKGMKPPVGFAGSEPVFNGAALWAGYDAVVVTEGWFDALSVAQAATTITAAKVGAVALGGADAHGRLLELLTARPTTTRLLVAMDDDDHGREGGRRLAQKLTAIGQRNDLIDGAKVWAAWTMDDGTRCKDASDVLQTMGDDGLAVSIEEMLMGTATITDDDLHAQDGSDHLPPIETGS